jgi:hypothetical protein
MFVIVHNVTLNLDLCKTFVEIHLGQHKFRTKVSLNGEWNEKFYFPLSFHNYLFQSVQFDVHEDGILFPRHFGRAEIKLSVLNIDDTKPFSSHFELWEKQLSAGNVSEITKRRELSRNIGAIYVTIKDLNTFVNDDDEEATPRTVGIPVTDESECSSLESTKKLLTGGEELPKSSNITNNFMGKVGEWILSKETNSVLQTIRRVFKEFGQGLDITNSELISAFITLEKFYLGKRGVPLREKIVELSFIENPKHFLRYALACYGWKGLNFFGKRPGGIIRDLSSFDADRKSIVDYICIPPDNILSFEIGTQQIFRPSFFIALDEIKDSIVLAIRGTMSVADSMTDLVCDYAKYKVYFLLKTGWFGPFRY